MGLFKKTNEKEASENGGVAVGEAATQGFSVLVNPGAPARLKRYEARLARLRQRIAETEGDPNKAAKNSEWKRGVRRLEVLIMLAKGEL